MPIYEYKCLKCQHHFEAMQKFSDEPLSTCPKCSGAVKKQVSATSFHLKGSGWYMTDYSNKHTSAPASESSESSSSSSSASSSTSESKPSTTSSDSAD